MLIIAIVFFIESIFTLLTIKSYWAVTNSWSDTNTIIYTVRNTNSLFTKYSFIFRCTPTAIKSNTGTTIKTADGTRMNDNVNMYRIIAASTNACN
jgi:hypothetical protein